MEFTEIEFDADLDELESDELATLVREYADAQADNKETMEEATERLGEFEEFESELTDEVAAETALPREEAERLSFSGKRDLLDAAEPEPEAEAEAEAEEFDDMGAKGQTDFEENNTGTSDFVEGAIPDQFLVSE